MAAALYLDTKTNILWRNVADKPIAKEMSLQPVEAREKFFCEGPWRIHHNQQVRVFINDKNELALFLIYKSWEEMGPSGAWYSLDGFDYQNIELYKGDKHMIAMLQRTKDGWWRAEDIYFHSEQLPPVLVQINRGWYNTHDKALNSVSPRINTMKKVFTSVKTETLVYDRKFTPERITKDNIQPNEIFVFGSNIDGMHGGGAAAVASRFFGAIWGKGVGLQGQSYAIPTIPGTPRDIKPYVDEFIQFAKDNPDKVFLVTRIGCGIAGFTEADMAPLLADALPVENIILPEEFVNYLLK